jgi:hypothetical protein
MKFLSGSILLRTMTWLALVLAVALAADLVEDLIFEVSEAAAVDEDSQPEASDDTVPSSRILDAPPLSLSFPLILSQATGTAFAGPLLSEPCEGHVPIHGPPATAADPLILAALPLRI